LAELCFILHYFKESFMENYVHSVVTLVMFDVQRTPATMQIQEIGSSNPEPPKRETFF